MRTECNRPIEEREKGGQQDSLMVKETQVCRWASGSNRSADGQAEGRPMEKKKVAIEKIRQKESTTEAGQSTIGNRSKSQFREF
jgi:hypothetical protein